MPCSSAVMNLNGNHYSAPVRLGNWVEDLYLKEDELRYFKRQRDKRELLAVKTRELYDNFYKDVELDAPKMHISYDSVVQVMPASLNICDMDASEINPALSVVVNERGVHTSQTVNEDCELTVAPSDKSLVRNSFRILRSNKIDQTSKVIRYGEHFRLQCMEPTDDPIYVYSAPKMCNLSHPINSSAVSLKNGEINLPLGLVHRSKCGIGRDVPFAFTDWFCLHVDPQSRCESTFQPVPSNTPLILVHASTNKNMAVENIVVRTLFGPELLVSVQNYRNSYIRESWKNLWVISNGQRKTA
ncbi:cilia- and flagella-associated protein 161-like [Scaptodrosophila lebanonensis]|uniref:Cilia- and flagella-associated protein 161-like n=1 Tax=Drosophila lebanonensis TaxID=7225 RepID=A0A6J2UH18_DROLE|nr:cilia- and flagella-associated protein 161-like [Scaptodrosophila lebanonensis]